MRLETILTPAEIQQLTQDRRVERVCVVFDILRATTSIVTGLAHGMERVIPVASLEEARQLRATHPEFLLGGERQGFAPEGFDLGNSPAEYCRHPGRTVVTTTTNGTVALRACAHAPRVLAAALLNLTATVQAVRARPPDVLQIVCAGTLAGFALEDGVAAGLLARSFPDEEKDDATLAMVGMVEGAGEEWPRLVRAAANARTLVRNRLEADVEWALQRDVYADLVVECTAEGCRRAVW